MRLTGPGQRAGIVEAQAVILPQTAQQARKSSWSSWRLLMQQFPRDHPTDDGRTTGNLFNKHTCGFSKRRSHTAIHRREETDCVWPTGRGMRTEVCGRSVRRRVPETAIHLGRSRAGRWGLAAEIRLDRPDAIRRVADQLPRRRLQNARCRVYAAIHGTNHWCGRRQSTTTHCRNGGRS